LQKHCACGKTAERQETADELLHACSNLKQPVKTATWNTDAVGM